MADRFREYRRDVISSRNDLPLPAHFIQPNHTLKNMKIAVLKAGLANQKYCKKQEMRFIFRQQTMAPSGLNQNHFHLNSLFCPLARRRALSGWEREVI